jgi:DNA-binding MarR family transcriptional regulator
MSASGDRDQVAEPRPTTKTGDLGNNRADSARMPIGQLLGNLLRLFRTELYARGETAPGATGIRPAHLQVFGTIKAQGSRLTVLAGESSMSLSSMAELVDDLESLGYLKRRADPTDGRAKLVCLTDAGWHAIGEGQRIIEKIEGDWGRQLGAERFESLCQSLQTLLDQLDPKVAAQYVASRSTGSDADI